MEDHLVLLQIIHQVDHFSTRHGGADSLIGFIENPERKDDPETVEECKIEPTELLVSFEVLGANELSKSETVDI